MAKKDGELAAQIVGGVAAFAAAHTVRKVLSFTWTRAMGKEPPNEPDAPDVSLGEAVAWAVVTGVGAEVARVIVVRGAYKRLAPYRHEEIEDLPL